MDQKSFSVRFLDRFGVCLPPVDRFQAAQDAAPLTEGLMV
jgi:hypothetical protein